MKRPLALAFAVCLSAPAWGQAPQASLRYRADLTRSAQAVWGIRAPVALFAGQIAQESAWRPEVCSAYACGLTQFTEDTARWMADTYGVELRTDDAPAARFDPRWSIRALVRYDKHLYDRAKGRTDCDRWWWALRGYNGGEGHLRMEARTAADPLDRRSVAAQCGKARRHASHCAENTGYPQKIIGTHQPRYATWGQGVKCD